MIRPEATFLWTDVRSGMVGCLIGSLDVPPGTYQSENSLFRFTSFRDARWLMEAHQVSHLMADIYREDVWRDEVDVGIPEMDRPTCSCATPINAGHRLMTRLFTFLGGKASEDMTNGCE